MLTQVAEKQSFLLDNERIPVGLMSASVQTWSDDVPVWNSGNSTFNIWRKKAMFVWNGDNVLNLDGSYSVSDFQSNAFNWDNGALNPHWLKSSELTLYDIHSHGIEIRDVNGNSLSSLMTEDARRVIGSAVNARHADIAISGAEYYLGNSFPEGGVIRNEGKPSRAHKHTGEYSLLVEPGKSGFSFTLEADKADLTQQYQASVWVYAPGEAESQDELNQLQLFYVENGVEKGVSHPVVKRNRARSWYLLNLDIDPEGSHDVIVRVRNNSQRGVYFDDFRVHPVGAEMTGFVYDGFSGELTFLLDANNFYTRFEYDAMGRLIRTSKELLNFDFGDGKESYRAEMIINDIRYNYGKDD